MITRIVSTVSDLQVFDPHTESRLFCALTLHSTIVDNNNNNNGSNGIDDVNGDKVVVFVHSFLS